MHSLTQIIAIAVIVFLIILDVRSINKWQGKSYQDYQMQKILRSLWCMVVVVLIGLAIW